MRETSASSTETGFSLELPLREWAYVHTELGWIYDHEVPARYRDARIDPSRGGYSAWLIRRGTVKVETSLGSRLEAGPGKWLLVPAGGIRQQFTEDARILSLHFQCRWPSGESIFSGEEGLVVAGTAYPALERLGVRLERVVRRKFPTAETGLFSRHADFEAYALIDALFRQWLATWFRAQRESGAKVTRLSADDDRLLRAVRCLNGAPLSKGLPREALRLESGLGDAQLNRLFLAEYGSTLTKPWEQRRRNTAKSYLETSTMPIKEIAFNLGFRTDSHFVLRFKPRTGLRPKHYRQGHREIRG